MSVVETHRKRERRYPPRIIATLIATCMATCLATCVLIVQAPAAGASSSAAKRTPAVAILPFGGDVFTVAQNGVLIPVDPRSTSDSAPCSTSRETH